MKNRKLPTLEEQELYREAAEAGATSERKADTVVLETAIKKIKDKFLLGELKNE